MRRFLFVSLLLGCASTPPPAAHPAAEPADDPSPPVVSLPAGDLQVAISGAHRTDEERARDPYRHPRETLEFFGIRPSMTVLEVWPGRGWYTKILAPYVRGQGKLIVANVDPDSEGFLGELVAGMDELLASQPTLYDQVEKAGLYPGHLLDEVPDASVDLVILPRTLHNWIRQPQNDAAAYLGALARVLRPGGVLGVVQHRAPPGHASAETGEAGYLSEDFVIRLVSEAGFELDERAEINANPNDDHDHPDGVWSLPPTLRCDENEHTSMETIGESDRMTLRFVRLDTPAPTSDEADAPDEADAADEQDD